MKRSVFCLVAICIGFSVKAQNAIDTFRLYFDLNVSALNKNMERRIDLLIYNDKIINGSNITIVGYADYLGTDEHNKALSMLRAKNIKDYLVKYGIDGNSILMCMGKGEVNRKVQTDADGYPTDRRVDIVVNNSVPPRHNTANSEKSIDPAMPGKLVVKTRRETTTKGPASTGDIKKLTSLKEGQTLLLKNVYFPPGSHYIKPESYETLEMLYKILLENPTIRISIEGHVCCVPMEAPDANDIDTNEPMLSFNRAKSIYLYLVDKGIQENRLLYTGFGKRFPVVAIEKSEEDAEKNRRVEVRILSN